MASQKRFWFGFISGVLLIMATPSFATTFEAVGIAALDGGGLEQARKAAIKDAKHQAAIQAGAEVEMSESVSVDGVPLKSSRVRAPREFASVSVVREWREGEFLHVLIRADDRDLHDQSSVPRAYKKKVVSAQFTVSQPLQLEDIGDIWNGFPRELMARLEATKQVLPRTMARSILLDAGQAESDSGRLAVRQAAEQNDSQFVISGMILNAGTAPSGGYYGFFMKKQRHFEIEVFVHDGLTGAVVGHHRLNRVSEGEPTVGRSKPFGSAAFFSTDYGRNIDGAINELTEAIMADLERLPFAARIVRIMGSKVFVDAGATSSINSGDTMVVYQMKDESMLNALRGGAELGVPEVPVTTIAITQVQPLFASGELQGDPKSLKIRVGDLVRFESQK